MHRGYLLVLTAALLAIAWVLLFHFPSNFLVPTGHFQEAPAASTGNRGAVLAQQSTGAITVVGKVAVPGKLAWPIAQFPSTVLGAIKAAGGFTADALPSHVRLTRVTPAGKGIVIQVDVTSSQASNQDTTPSIWPGDIFFVPQRLWN